MQQQQEQVEVQEISWNELRVRLQQGLEKLLAVLPEGETPELKLGYSVGGAWRPVPDAAAEPLKLLCEFTSATETLLRHRPPAQVRELMHRCVGQCLIAEDDGWYQMYVD